MSRATATLLCAALAACGSRAQPSQGLPANQSAAEPESDARDAGLVEPVPDASSDQDETQPYFSIVSRRIHQRYLPGIKRCHVRLLKRDPEAGGEVKLRFTVGESGAVTSASADGFDAEVDRCIEGLAQAWRFEAPPAAADGKKKPLDFLVPLKLRAGAPETDED